MLKQYRHNPVHLLLDDTPYFITAAIHEKRPLLGTHEIKLLVRDSLQAVFEQYGWQLLHWVIVDNHYHLFAQSWQGKALPEPERRPLPTAICRIPIYWRR